MSVGKDFIKCVTSTCFERLAKIGMRKRSDAIATISINGNFTGWVGLNRETRRDDGYVRINPNVGLRYDAAHKLIAEIYGEKYYPYRPPTVSKNVGYLIPNRGSYIQFVFVSGEEIEPPADELAFTVREYGFPYMERHANTQDIMTLIKDDVAWDYSGELMLAIGYLSDLPLPALHEMVEERNVMAEKHKINDKAFLDFSKSFFQYVDKRAED